MCCADGPPVHLLVPWCLQTKYDAGSNSFAADTTAAVIEAVKGVGAGDNGSGGPSEKQLKQMAMPFAKYKMDEAIKAGGQVGGWFVKLLKGCGALLRMWCPEGGVGGVGGQGSTARCQSAACPH